MKTVKIVIHGKVQGVFFRATAKDMALNFHLTGWVRNKDDVVEIVATGSESALGRFIEWCQQGPDRARVDSVEVSYLSEEFFETFSIRR